MQGGRDPFFGFGDPFGSFGSFGRSRSLTSSFFGGRDPFDDPFFTRSFGSMFESHPFESMFNSSFFGPGGSPFMDGHASGLLEQQPSQPNRSRGPIIEELNSDDEKEEKEDGKEKKDRPRKHGRSNKEPLVEDGDEIVEKKSKQLPRGNGVNQVDHRRSLPQSRNFSFQSSTVTYGGADGAYYTSSRMRRSGSDGFAMEECKEANSATGEASHRLSRGIHEKGHSVSRKLNSDGRVDTMQTLHNLNEDELVGFEEAWNGNARKFLPGWNGGFATQNAPGPGRGHNRPNQGGWALPSVERSNDAGSMKHYSGHGAGPSYLQQHPGRMRVNSSDGSGSSRVRSRAAGSGSADQVKRR